MPLTLAYNDAQCGKHHDVLHDRRMAQMKIIMVFPYLLYYNGKRGEQMKKKKRNYTRTIDLLFLLVLLIAILYAFNNIISSQLLPQRWLLLAAAAALIIFILLFRSMMKRRRKWFVWARRLLITVLCAVLFTGSFYTGKVGKLLTDISAETEITTEIRILARNDGSLSSLSELSSGLSVGIQNGTDSANGEYAKQALDADAPGCVYDEETYYGDLLASLSIGYLDAVAISDTYYDMMIDNETISESDFITLKTYTYTRTWEDPSDKDVTKDSFVLYISGIDEMGSPDQKLRSDVNLLLMINPQAHHVTMVSLPRDAYIPNKAYEGSGFSLDKLTHTGLYGVDTTIETVEDFLDIDIDYYARISFSSVIEIIDVLGGIDVDVEIDFCEQDENRNKDEAHQICLAKGEQHLDGRQALAYARHRKTEGYDSAGRERAQQRILKAIIDKLLSVDGISSLSKLFDIIPSYVITNMPSDKIAAFARAQLEDMRPWAIESLSLENGVNTHMMLQASLNDYSDAYVFSRQDVQYIEWAYESNEQRPKMSSFSFNLSDIAAGTKQISDDGSLVWSDQVIPY